MTYYKAVQMDGTDFRSGTVRWLPPVGETLPDGGWVVAHSSPKHGRGSAEYYLSASTVPTACTGMLWPCRLAELESVDGCEPWAPHPDNMPKKWAACEWRVVREIDPLLALGPQAAHVVALIERAERITPDEAVALSQAWGAGRGTGRDAAHATTRVAALCAARSAAWDAARDAARGAVWGEAWDAAPDAAPDAALSAVRHAAWGVACGVARDAVDALVARDLISVDTYATLVRPWATAIGRVHPDDAEVTP